MNNDFQSARQRGIDGRRERNRCKKCEGSRKVPLAEDQLGKLLGDFGFQVNFDVDPSRWKHVEYLLYSRPVP